jgi:hypothetical protein
VKKKLFREKGTKEGTKEGTHPRLTLREHNNEERRALAFRLLLDGNASEQTIAAAAAAHYLSISRRV